MRGEFDRGGRSRREDKGGNVSIHQSFEQKTNSSIVANRGTTKEWTENQRDCYPPFWTATHICRQNQLWNEQVWKLDQSQFYRHFEIKDEICPKASGFPRRYSVRTWIQRANNCRSTSPFWSRDCQVWKAEALFVAVLLSDDKDIKKRGDAEIGHEDIRYWDRP